MRKTRRPLPLVLAALILMGAGTSATGAPSLRPDTGPHAADHHLVPGGTDGDSWRKRMVQQKRTGTTATPRGPSGASVVAEKNSGGNERLDGAQRVPRPKAKKAWDLRLKGTLSTQPVTRTSVPPSHEDDGAIPLARKLELNGNQRAITTTGRLGDGPHGSQGTNQGDYDFYEFRAAAGDTLTVDIDPQAGLPPQIFLYDARGNLQIGAMDLTGTGDVHLSHPIAKKGTYYLGVGIWRPTDPFTSGSGPAWIIEGNYTLDLSLRSKAQADTDVFLLPLRKGDVLGATVHGSAKRIALYSLDGKLLQSSQVDTGGIYPERSPLPKGGNATANHIVTKNGLYALSISDGSGAYSVTIGVRRPEGLPRQTILLDFSGPTFDNRIFVGAVVEPGVRQISPMRAFLPRWGLQTDDERAVIEATTRLVDRILRQDIPGSKVQVVNSLTHPNAFGNPGVSRVIVGGTIEESGLIGAFGLAESIDPGNFAREETAIVLPERMSSDTDLASLNLRMTAASNRVQAVSQVLGNTAAHEVGHLLGNFHTDDFDDHSQVMNSGYRLNLLSVGQDGVAGTYDDDVLGMRDSRYDPFQGLAGVESAPARTWLALR